VAVDGPADPAEAEGERAGRPKLLASAVAGERRQVGVTERGDVDRALHVVDPPSDDALEGDRHREERVRDTGVAPVEDQVAAVAGVDGAVVEVVVLDRLGDPVAGQLRAHRRHPRDGVAQPAHLV